MNHLKEIFSLLEAELVVMFENNFSFEDVPDRILHDLLYLNEYDFNLLLQFFESKGAYKFVKALTDFVAEYDKLYLIHADKLTDLYEDEIGEAIRQLKEENLEFGSLYELYRCSKSEFEIIASEDILNEINRYGIAVNYPLHYEQTGAIIKEKRPWKSQRIFKNYNSGISVEIKENLQKAINSKSKFWVCIIDNLFEDGPQAEKIIYFLTEEFEKKNIASVVLSSQIDNNWNENFKDYYVEFISKDNNSNYNISKGLAFCVYKMAFLKLKSIHLGAVDESYKTALENKENMQYLACMAYEEGVTAFEILKKWFDLALSKNISERLSIGDVDFEMIIKITSFLNISSDESLFNSENIPIKLEENLNELNNYEIFDVKINLQHQPPAPGDVFALEGNENKFYILVGQDCDLTVRSDEASRNEKHAELLSANFNPYGLSEKTEVSKKSEISLNYFVKETYDGKKFEQQGALCAKFGNRQLIDFSILDTCTFNTDGFCKIALEDEINGSIANLITDAWKDVYKSIQRKFKVIADSEELLTNSNLKNVVLMNGFSGIKYKITNNYMVFPLRRICRIRDEFKYLLVKRYWDYRGRIGYNTINISKVQNINCSFIDYKFPGDEKLKEIKVEYNALVERSNKRSKNSDLTNVVWKIGLESIRNAFEGIGISFITEDDDFVLTENCELESATGSFIYKKKKLLEEKQQFGLEIKLPFTIKRITDGKRITITKETTNFFELTGISKEEYKNEEIQVYYKDKKTKVDVLNEKGEYKRLNIVQVVSKGLFVSKKDYFISMDKTSGQILVGIRDGISEAAASIPVESSN